MERIRTYVKPIWYNIIHHKAYAGFCVFGTMLTFVFITILLQVAYVILCDTAPAVAADRIVSVPFVLRDNKGEAVKGLNKSDIRTLMNNVREEVCYTSYHYEAVDIIVNGRYDEYGIYFIDRNYWNVFQFELLQGHFFTEDEMQMSCVIVNENFVRSFSIRKFRLKVTRIGLLVWWLMFPILLRRERLLYGFLRSLVKMNQMIG